MLDVYNHLFFHNHPFTFSKPATSVPTMSDKDNSGGSSGSGGSGGSGGGGTGGGAVPISEIPKDPDHSS